jgi:hypothetical protein
LKDSLLRAGGEWEVRGGKFHDRILLEHIGTVRCGGAGWSVGILKILLSQRKLVDLVTTLWHNAYEPFSRRKNYGFFVASSCRLFLK